MKVRKPENFVVEFTYDELLLIASLLGGLKYTKKSNPEVVSTVVEMQETLDRALPDREESFTDFFFGPLPEIKGVPEVDEDDDA